MSGRRLVEQVFRHQMEWQRKVNTYSLLEFYLVTEILKKSDLKSDRLLEKKGNEIKAGNIAALFKKHGITKKKQNMRL